MSLWDVQGCWGLTEVSGCAHGDSTGGAVVVQEGIPGGVRRVGACQCAQGCECEWHMLGV